MAYKTTADRFYDMKDVIQPEPPALHKDTHWKVGDKVKFTNDYGVEFGPFIVQGYTKPENQLGDKFIYINSDSPWFPVSQASLSKWVPKAWLVRDPAYLHLIYADTEEEALAIYEEGEGGLADMDDVTIDPLPTSNEPASFVLWSD